MLMSIAKTVAMPRDRIVGAGSEGDVEERQNDELLKGNSEILRHVEALEGRILELEKQIVARLDARDAGRTEPTG